MLRHLKKRETWTSAGGVTRITLAALLLGALWRLLRFGLNFPLWGDEAGSALSLMLLDFWDLSGQLLDNWIAPLGYLWLQWGINQILGFGEMALRLMPLAAGLLAMYLFYRFACKVLSRWEAMLACALFACTYGLVRYSVELRSFSLDVLSAAALISLAHHLALNPEHKRGWQVFFLVSALAMWISYAAVFVGAGVLSVLGVYLIWSQRLNHLKNLLIAGLSLGLSFLAVYFIHISPQIDSATVFLSDQSNQWAGAWPPWSQPWLLPWWLLKTHAGPMLSYPNGGNSLGSIVSLVLVFIGGISLKRQGKTLLLWLLVSPALMGLAAATLHLHPYGNSIRIMLYLAVSICLLFGAGAVSSLKFLLSRRYVGVGCLAVVGFFMLFSLGGITRDLVKPYKHKDDFEVRQAFEDLKTRIGSNDNLQFFTEYGPLPPDELRWHMRGYVVRYYTMLSFPRLQDTWPAKVWPPQRYRDDGLSEQMLSQKTWLLFYNNASRSLNQSQLRVRLQALARQYNEPDKHSYQIELDRGQSSQLIEAYEFSPR